MCSGNTPPPSNNECSAAIPLTINPFGTSCTTTTTVITNGATQSSFNPASCTSIDNNDDLWYSFVATSQSIILRASNIINTVVGGNAGAGYALYESVCPGSTTAFSCDAGFAFGGGHRIISGLTIGNTYFLRLWVQGTHNYGSIDINGRIIYSKVEKLNASKKENLFLSVYPNPANKGITIGFNNISNETAIISIFDISGRKLKQFQQINLNGKIILNISHFKTGIYLMKIDIGGRTYQKKFIK